VIELTTQVLGFVAMVTHALLTATVWALVTGAITAAVAKSVLSHAILPGHRSRLRWEPGAVRELTTFGRWVLVSSFVTILSQKFDVLALGRLLTVDQLGVYSLALVVVMAPREIVAKLSTEVLLPVLSAAQRTSREELASRYEAAHRVMMPGMLVIVLGAGLGAPPLFHLLFDPRYHGAGWMALTGMLGTWFFLQGAITADTLVALGNSKRLAAASAARAVMVPVGGLVGYTVGDLPGFIIGYSLGQLPPYVVAAVSVGDHGIPVLRLDTRYTLLVVTLGLAGALVPRALGASQDALTVALIEVAVGGVILTALAPWVLRSILPVLRQRRAAA